MALKLGKITANTVESFQWCRDALDRLNEIVQTANNKEVPVDLRMSVLGATVLIVTPSFRELGQIRIIGTVQVDLHIDEDYIWIKRGDERYKILLKEETKK